MKKRFATDRLNDFRFWGTAIFLGGRAERTRSEPAWVTSSLGSCPNYTWKGLAEVQRVAEAAAMSAVSQAVRRNVKGRGKGAAQGQNRQLQGQGSKGTPTAARSAELRAKKRQSSLERNRGKGEAGTPRTSYHGLGDASDALVAQLERSKSESTGLWKSIIDDRGGGAVDKDAMAGPSTSGEAVLTKRGTRVSEARRRMNSVHDADPVDGSGDEDDDDAEDYTLPLESVSGYPTPWLLLHPNHPSKVSWDLLIGGEPPLPALSAGLLDGCHSRLIISE